MTETYCSKDEWAKKKGFANFAAYNGKYPPLETLIDMLEDMTQLMNIEIGDVTTNITSAKYTIYLRNLCYRGVELMIDEEQGRSTEVARPTFIPRDYMFARDRQKLQRIGLEFDHRVVGGVSS